MAKMIAYKLRNNPKVFHTTSERFQALVDKHGAGSVKMVGSVDVKTKAEEAPAKVTPVRATPTEKPVTRAPRQEREIKPSEKSE